MNIMLIHTHDTGKYISPYGYNTPTPALLEFAKDAFTFRNAFNVGPTCSPSRSGLLTGTYPHQNGMLGLSHRGFNLNDPQKHLAYTLKEKGYHTVLCGIQHEHHMYSDKEAYKYLGYVRDISSDVLEIDDHSLYEWDIRNAQNLKNYLYKLSETKKKFFVSYGMFSTHRPYPNMKELDSRYLQQHFPSHDNQENREDVAKFNFSLSVVDQNFKLIIQTLKELNLYDETLIIFTTDHGVADPFAKCTLYDTGIGVSLLMRKPMCKQGIVIDSMVSHIDIYPTIYDLIGIDKPEFVEGKSFAEIFNNPKLKLNLEIFSEINFHTSYEPIRCIRTDKYKYIKYYDNTFRKYNLSNIDDSSIKTCLMKNGLMKREKVMEALYDLTIDPSERENLIDNQDYSIVLEDLKKRLARWQQKTNDPILDGEIMPPRLSKGNKRACINPGSTDPLDYETT